MAYHNSGVWNRWFSYVLTTVCIMNYSVEKLFHFTCEHCSLWWSVAHVEPFDWPLTGNDDMSMTCPHCSHKHLPPHKDITIAH